MKKQSPVKNILIYKPEINGEKEFRRAIGMAMKTTTHTEALLDIVKEFEEYNQFPILHMNDVLVSSIDYRRHPKIGFIFDFGDDHRFFMRFKGERKAEKNEKKGDFPKLIDQRCVSPEQYHEWN